ncbi:MAG: Bro-N domain-containing protein [Eubacterium sp.]|nr:Bro-N domain-containing protein [Eubacterium sp.]
MINDELYFVGKDVATILGYERATKAIADHVDEEDIDEVPIQNSIGRMQNTPVINESGLYSLILSSKLQKRGLVRMPNPMFPSLIYDPPAKRHSLKILKKSFIGYFIFGLSKTYIIEGLISVVVVRGMMW